MYCYLGINACGCSGRLFATACMLYAFRGRKTQCMSVNCLKEVYLMIFRHWGGTYKPLPYIRTHPNPLSVGMACFEAIFAVMQIGIENKQANKKQTNKQKTEYVSALK